jgi:hypothetical protein
MLNYSYRLIFACISILLLMAVSIGCRCEPVVRHFERSTLYVCSGETVRFEWDIDCIDKVKFYTGTGQHLDTFRGESGSFVTPPVQANWNYIEARIYKGSDYETRGYPIHIMDNPQWTREYFDYDETGLRINSTGYEIVPDPTSEGDRYIYYEWVESYTYHIPANEYSNRARVINVRYGRTPGYATIELDIDGMYIMAWGVHNVPMTWVPIGDVLEISAPFHPSEATWQLLYDEPQLVPIAYVNTPEIVKPGTDFLWIPDSQYPSISFEVICCDGSLPCSGTP